ncbi:MAG: hypothetical protein K1X89_21345 [Myxococcaceae bacterium]|nr:hypothetical protein [Myxococcaceae bacterium]
MAFAASAQPSPDESWSTLPSAADAGVVAPVPTAPPLPPPTTPPAPGARPGAGKADETWFEFPGAPTVAPSVAPPSAPPTSPPSARLPDGPALTLPPVMAAPSAPRTVLVKPRPPDKPNRISVFGAPTLGQWKRGESVIFGFPTVEVRAYVGLLDWLDAGLTFQSMYGFMNDLRAVVKAAFVNGPGVSLGASLEGGVNFFVTRAARETNGPRWITGRRNFALSPALTATYQGSSPRSGRAFLTLRYLLAFDTEPFAKDPLAGVPSSLVLGHNFSATIGAEIPVTETTSFVFAFGLEVHGRSEDSPAMPTAHLGFTTSL